MQSQAMRYDAERDCYVQETAEPDVSRRLYGTSDGKLRIEETREFNIQSGLISEHSACIASLNSAGPLLTNEDVSEAMQSYFALEGCSGL